MKALGIGIDFYSEQNIWAYIIAFLLLRVISLVVSLLIVLVSNWRQKERLYGLGHVVVIWLCLTWISTVIMGVPISSAVFGDGTLGRKYGILAAISSFIFQLPVMLVFLESYALDRDRDDKNQSSNHTEESNRESIAAVHEEQAVELASGVATNGDTEVALATVDNDNTNNENDMQDISLDNMEKAPNDQQTKKALPPQEQVHEEWWQLTGGRYVNRRDVWIDICKRVFQNPVLWGIFFGFVLTLSTVGPTYLNPSSPDYVVGLGWIDTTLTWLGDMVSPLSLFAMGVWMQAQGWHQLFFAVPPYKLLLCMMAKLVLVPLVMVGLAIGMDLNNQMGRAAVLIASLPISLASFSLGKQYSIGEAVLSANVAVGTVLMLPTVLVWNIVMDSIGLFPVE